MPHPRPTPARSRSFGIGHIKHYYHFLFLLGQGRCREPNHIQAQLLYNIYTIEGGQCKAVSKQRCRSTVRASTQSPTVEAQGGHHGGRDGKTWYVYGSRPEQFEQWRISAEIELRRAKRKGVAPEGLGDELMHMLPPNSDAFKTATQMDDFKTIVQAVGGDDKILDHLEKRCPARTKTAVQNEAIANTEDIRPRRGESTGGWIGRIEGNWNLASTAGVHVPPFLRSDMLLESQNMPVGTKERLTLVPTVGGKHEVGGHPDRVPERISSLASGTEGLRDHRKGSDHGAGGHHAGAGSHGAGPTKPRHQRREQFERLGRAHGGRGGGHGRGVHGQDQHLQSDGDPRRSRRPRSTSGKRWRTPSVHGSAPGAPCGRPKSGGSSPGFASPPRTR